MNNTIAVTIFVENSVVLIFTAEVKFTVFRLNFHKFGIERQSVEIGFLCFWEVSCSQNYVNGSFDLNKIGSPTAGNLVKISVKLSKQ